METLADLYREAGNALHKAQLAEYNIISVYILLSRTGPLDSIKEIEESYWSKKTLGQLLKPAIDSGHLPEEVKLFLETFRNARNHLAHSFFVSASEVHTSKGVNNLLAEVTAMQDVFDRAYQLFDHLLSELAQPCGINAAEIKGQASLAVLNLKGDAACKD
jgi:hypothetical protein